MKEFTPFAAHIARHSSTVLALRRSVVRCRALSAWTCNFQPGSIGLTGADANGTSAEETASAAATTGSTTGSSAATTGSAIDGSTTGTTGSTAGGATYAESSSFLLLSDPVPERCKTKCLPPE